MVCVNYCAVRLTLRIGSILVCIALTLQIIGLVSPTWFNYTRTGTNQEGQQGLWTHCYTLGNYACCGDVSHNYDSGMPDWLKAARVISIICFVGGVSTVVLFFLAACCINKPMAMASLILTMFTGVFLFILLIEYVATSSGENWTSKTDYSLSVYMTAFAGIGYIVAGILLIIGLCTASLLD